MNLLDRFGLFPFTARDAKQAGLTHHEWLVIKAELVRLRHGVYVAQDGSDSLTRYRQKVAGELIAHTDHFATSMSAVALLGLPQPFFHSWDTEDVRIAGPRTRSGRRIVRSTGSPIPTAWGPSADLIETATLIAAQLPLPDALVITDAIALRLGGTADFEVRASQACRDEVRRQLTRYSDLPALRLADPAADAPSESFYRGHLILRGHTGIACGVPVLGDSGSLYFVDLSLDGLMIEIDGEVKYTHLDSLVAEKDREDDLRATGGPFHRVWVKRMLASPGQEMERLDRKLAEVRFLGRCGA